MKRRDDLHKDEHLDFFEERKRQEGGEIFDYDRPSLFQLAVNAYRALLRTNSLSEAEKVVKLMATVFGRKKQSDSVERAVKELEAIQEQHVERTSGGDPASREEVRLE
ncbi:hypothetical protein FOCC_FOCC009463 [Frankliniella occidentalis]|nr:hypothetical protein FOCC_FOCC009463 [Frankliniella occidentalis]